MDDPVLKPYRDRLDRLDDEIVDRFVERMRIVREIGRRKRERALPVMQNDREEAIRAALEEAEVFAYGDGCSPSGFCYHGEPKRTIILLTGKGRETREKRGREFIPVESDVAIVEKLIGE